MRQPQALSLKKAKELELWFSISVYTLYWYIQSDFRLAFTSDVSIVDISTLSIYWSDYIVE